MIDPIKNFFYPESICLVGASTKEKSIGFELLKTMKSYGYTGKIFPVNPKADFILGYKCYRSPADIGENTDLAIVVVPKQFVENSIDDLINIGVKSIVLITAGFKETGKEGEAHEKRIVEKIKCAGVRLVGPNCMGVISTLPSTKLNATFVAETPETGTMGFLSQSGALGAAVLNSLRETDIKFAHFISVGNKADINENDLLDFWENDDNIKIITLYLESFVDGESFIKNHIRSSLTKPVIILKAGKTSGGMRAASSHTGALSSKDLVVEAILNQFGIIRATDLNELFNTAKGFESFPLPKGNKVAIVTNAGGPGILAADSLEKENLVLAELTSSIKDRLREVVPAEGSVENPVDLLPGATPEIYSAVNQILLDDPGVDAIISIFVEPVMVQPFDVVEAVYDIISDKPIIQVDMPLPEFWDTYRKKSKKHLPVFKNPEDPAAVISNMLFYNNTKNRLLADKPRYMNQFLQGDRITADFCPGFLSQFDIEKLCRHYDLPIIQSTIVNRVDLENLTDLAFPLVIKGINREVIHKSELNAVKLNIKNKEQLLSEANDITASFEKYHFNVEEFLIQPCVKIKHEILIGGYRDPSFGPIIMFGTGGKYVEVICDTAVRSAYLTDEDINDLISSTVLGKILNGVRGEAPVNIEKVKKILRSAAKMLVENDNISEFDINPLIVSEDNQLYAVDLRIKIS